MGAHFLRMETWRCWKCSSPTPPTPFFSSHFRHLSFPLSIGAEIEVPIASQTLSFIGGEILAPGNFTSPLLPQDKSESRYYSAYIETCTYFHDSLFQAARDLSKYQPAYPCCCFISLLPSLPPSWERVAITIMQPKRRGQKIKRRRRRGEREGQGLISCSVKVSRLTNIFCKTSRTWT